MSVIGEPVCLAPVGDVCGEAALWCEAENALYWTDVNRFLIHRIKLADNSVQSWFFDEPVVSLALTDRDGTLLVAIGSRLLFWEPATDARRDHGFRLPGWPNVRLNDGRPDPLGNFWIGSMRNNVRADGTSGEAGGTEGILYRITPSGDVTEWVHGLAISNTLTWSPDGRKFYFGDSIPNIVRVYDVAENGDISGGQTFFEGFERGGPDGSAMDAEGYLWNARFGGRCIVRVAPSGEIDRVIEMPVQNITTCTFGGPDLKTLFVTTARLEAPESDRLAGGLYAIATEVTGQRENVFRCFGG
ncbi:gluconolactonase [Faunimonas pinastri]|uniref:Gluconolactonase n=1 Tax=Faunimonas pinastri TaxID=1855383 RepID=A0A1H9A2F2_9HYPH|nr:SMP-30/gluconolactonase/LRE family protein [Faunimonas pinastri]SEP70839.1 gluconolactonase [Faunimonas pinastri]